MQQMKIHPEFRSMVSTLYQNPEARVKINGHVGVAWQPKNGLHQGDPLSPLLYLLCLQSYISLVNRDAE